MTTKELISAIAQETGMRRNDVAKLMAATTQAATEELINGNSIQIQNFGLIEVKKKNERLCVHPRSGERKIVPAKMQVSFKQNPILKESINKK
ncbi:MAG: HU family DNA-binding protein [Paludibacteraceae bacterium]|nr:HU family DNA-binding protein [Paludibacteraceae bacterium]